MFGIGKKKQSRHNGRVPLFTQRDASFSFVEAYKSLRTNVDFVAGTNRCKTILLTSTAPGEGKTTTSINLAFALADGGKKVILVDCDLRKGTIASYMKLGRSRAGITDVLRRKKTLEEAIIHSQKAQPDILLCGKLPPNPSEVLGSEAMISLVGTLAEKYDFVILDTPPVLVVTDAAVLSRYVDGCVLVAKADVTTKIALNNSRAALEDVNANILGVVLNSFDKRNKHYNGRYEYYGSYGYGEEGGSGQRSRSRRGKKDRGTGSADRGSADSGRSSGEESAADGRLKVVNMD